MDNNKFLSIPFVILFTFYDILIVEGIFSKLQLWEEIHIYHQATYTLLVPLLILICAVGSRSWRFAMYSAIGIRGGWLDLCYFWFQLKPLPDYYSWFYIPMSGIGLIFYALSLLILAVVIDLISYIFTRLKIKNLFFKRGDVKWMKNAKNPTARRPEIVTKDG